MKGQSSQKVRREIGDGRLGVVVDGRLVTILRSEVNEYLDDWFWSAFGLWYRYKLFGALPFSGGWAELPAFIVEIIETAEGAYRNGYGINSN
ncbi:hypothetical protein [Sediminispirochaeta smaragdinae]|uniref:Uncharacterized protein n=1 Tax=Sediminispirochaeta smaragdinae (strain DSM 11293 / JCM 15392 / SEBR 4228) TaxID=573413 RepID=E1R3H1_SEDSS|nr:hypothetical protein [Sediminispirochaeta smaragdinae]ADK81602.1 hypothetical protein Spirs_2489 [Sediminispirochaeta smaragdinae DSM 11293]